MTFKNNSILQEQRPLYSLWNVSVILVGFDDDCVDDADVDF